MDIVLLSSATWHNSQCLNSLIASAWWKLLFPEDRLEIGRHLPLLLRDQCNIFMVFALFMHIHIYNMILRLV